jgi:ribosomal protein L11 methyltransferase
MFVWRKRAGARWLAAEEERLNEIAGTRLAIIQSPNRRTASVEISGTSRRDLEKIRTRFGGTIERLPRDWLTRAQEQKAKPIKIGKRLLIARLPTVGRAPRPPGFLVIPAGAAFGTGEHATTVMALRFIEQIAKTLPADWSMLDLGTGSGILTLAAREFGAKRVVAIDFDPVAISVAKENARLNGIDEIDFRVADVRKFSSMIRFQIVTANLYSELLIEILPKLGRSEWLIASGVLREKEPEIVRALHLNKWAIVTTRRRGKWIALLARHSKRQSRDPVVEV